MSITKPSIRAFIAGNCANYFASDPGYRPKPWCEHRAKVCTVLGEGTRCKYFESAVLPIEPDMAGAYLLACTSQPERTENRVSPRRSDAHRRSQMCLERVEG